MEFFIFFLDWVVLKERLVSFEVCDFVCFYVSNVNGDFVFLDVSGGVIWSEELGSINVVIWGVFFGKEIIILIIIEEVSFRVWSEEVFGIWGEWVKVYGCGFDSEKLLNFICSDYWLVNIIYNDFVERDMLWDFLL